MGYLTSFDGNISVEPPLNAAEVEYLTRFSRTRRMKRTSGSYFVSSGEHYGQDKESDVECMNTPPDDQPGPWCEWVPTPDGSSIRCDEEEIKFYDADDWMRYLIKHFLEGSEGSFREHPDSSGFTFDHVANGVISAQGECCVDRWDLVVVDNIVTVKEFFPETRCRVH